MTEEEISSTGQYNSLGTSEIASYQPANAAAPPSASSTTGPQAVGGAAPVKPPSTQDINDAIAAANANLASSDRVLDYRVDAATGISVVLIRNAQTGAVLQQLPGANIIALAKMLADWSPGKHMLLDMIA